MNKVKLTEGLFKTSQDKGNEYLIYLDVDRLTAPCYEAAGLSPKKPRYGGWESQGISGHSIGHYLSAAAAMYVANGDKNIKEKLDYAVAELAYVQSHSIDGYVSGFPRGCFDKVFSGDFEVERFSLAGWWVPWYSIHKIYAGLIDAYMLTGNKQALEAVIKLSDWAVRGLSNLTDEQFEKMLYCEHGGMNEAMADLYSITDNKAYLNLAIRFCHKEILDPLAEGKDELEGKHANTQIPKVIGAAKLYDITGNEDYKNMALFFWNEVVKNRSYVIGGNSRGEHFGRTRTEELGVATAETCNTYNMMKLTELLYSWSQEARYMDYYETALYNHILASQDPHSGMKTYFVSTQPGHFKVYCSPDNSFWCCTGTGMENPARYIRQIYYRKSEELFVNLFISSELKLEDKNIKLRQETSFPEGDKVRLVFDEAAGEHLNINIRVPSWVKGAVSATVNNEEKYSRAESGYLTISRNWSEGDVIEFTVPMGLHKYEAMDDAKKVAIMYGPIVLAGALGKENFPQCDILEDHVKLFGHPGIIVPALVTDEKDITKLIKPLNDKPLTFETEAIGQPGDVKVTLIPFYALHHQRYTIYWKFLSTEEYRQSALSSPDYQEILDKTTVDRVSPNEQQPEVDHKIKRQNSKSDYLSDAGAGWRESINDGFFSYEMSVLSEQQNYLAVTYWGSDTDYWTPERLYIRNFNILIDNTVIANETLKEDKPYTLFDVFYEIPMELTKGKEKVEVKFTSTEGKMAGRVFGVRITSEKIK
jgi:DUF1680 family protein